MWNAIKGNTLVMTILILAICMGIQSFFEKHRDNAKLRKVYQVLIMLFWIVAVIITGLLFWAAQGYLRQGDKKTGIMLLIYGALMVFAVLGKVKRVREEREKKSK